MLGGRAWVRDGSEWRELRAGDVVWQSPDDETIARSDFDDPYCCLAVEFRVSQAGGMGIRRFSKWPSVEEIEQFRTENSGLICHEHFDRNTLRDFLYFRLLYQVRRYEFSLTHVRYPGPVGVVVARIERDFALPLRMEELEKEAGWSASHLHEEFLKQTGVTPHRMLIEKRLRVARERLLCTTDPIKRIASECGFFDLSAFAHTFRTHMGETPTAFRMRHWKPRS